MDQGGLKCDIYSTMFHIFISSSVLREVQYTGKTSSQHSNAFEIESHKLSFPCFEISLCVGIPRSLWALCLQVFWTFPTAIKSLYVHNGVFEDAAALLQTLSLRRSFVYAGIRSSVLEEVDKPRVKPPAAGLTVWEGAVSFLSLRE